MAANSKIEWCDHTQNFWVGCTKVSPACDFCYAEAWAKRTGHPELWAGERRRTKTWGEPIKWNTAAQAAGRRPRVFTNSLADFFDNQVDPQWRVDAWAMIRACSELDWLILTKRPENIRKMLPPDWGDGYHNVWLGTTVENQAQADRRISHLISIPARILFLSCEPLLGDVRLSTPALEQVDWVICGGESGAADKRRPMDMKWARRLRDDCLAWDTAFFMKQIDKVQPIPSDLMVREFPQ